MTIKPVILFGGKGGVGKTTCSAAVAAFSASVGRKTMVITSDMTPSLSDIFEKPVGDRVTPVDTNLWAFEISQQSIMARWKQRFSSDFSDILSQLVVRHVERLMKTLNDYKIELHGMVINRVVENRDPDPLTAIISIQQRYVAELKKLAEGLPQAGLPVSQEELKGVKALRFVGERLFRELRIS